MVILWEFRGDPLASKDIWWEGIVGLTVGSFVRLYRENEHYCGKSIISVCGNAQDPPAEHLQGMHRVTIVGWKLAICIEILWQRREHCGDRQRPF